MKKQSVKAFLIAAIFCFRFFTSYAIIYRDTVCKDNIKTVQLFKSGWEMSLPVIQLKTEDKLELDFDDVSDKAKRYFYTIIHCNADWEASD